jgi:uncharacterized membrane protein
MGTWIRYSIVGIFAGVAAMWTAPRIAAEPHDTSVQTLDFPGAMLTRAFGINARGDIVGLYIDAQNVTHGWLLKDGRYFSIDVPGAIRTNAVAINSEGQVAGRYDTPDMVAHGYVLSGDTVETIDAPGAAGFTVVTDISPDGDIVGRYMTADKKFHGFVRAGGVFTPIDHRDANGTPDMGPMGIQGMAINADGLMAGYYQDVSKRFHAFILDNGTFIPVAPPDALDTGGSGGVLHLNPRGDLVGGFKKPDDPVLPCGCGGHAFVYRAGTTMSYDLPGALVTTNAGINPQGDIVGIYVDAQGRSHGFLAPAGVEGGR